MALAPNIAGPDSLHRPRRRALAARPALRGSQAIQGPRGPKRYCRLLDRPRDGSKIGNRLLVIAMRKPGTRFEVNSLARLTSSPAGRSQATSALLRRTDGTDTFVSIEQYFGEAAHLAGSVGISCLAGIVGKQGGPNVSTQRSSNPLRSFKPVPGLPRSRHLVLGSR